MKLAFIYLGCGAQYLDPGELFRCTEMHLKQAAMLIPFHSGVSGAPSPFAGTTTPRGTKTGNGERRGQR